MARQTSSQRGPGESALRNPGWITALFSDTRFAWVWLILRIYIGWGWLTSGWDKLSNPAWVTTGDALKGFWTSVVAVPTSSHPAVAFDWYRHFLQFLLNTHSYTWFAKFIASGELLVGIGLLVGGLTGIAAFFGAVMSWSYMLAGLATTNPAMGLIAVGIVIAWRTAGWWGADRVVLPALGAPWQPGWLFGGEARVARGDTESPSVLVSRWVQMMLGVGAALYALAALSGYVEVVVLVVAGVFVAATGFGWLRLAPSHKR